jgi:hypothetical protein
MRFTSFIPSRCPHPQRDDVRNAFRRQAAIAALLAGLSPLACQDAPVDVGEPVEEPAPAPPSELPEGAVIELGIDAAPVHPMEGFSLPERVGARLASWSEGELSTVSFDLRGGARDYVIAFLAEPYHMLGEVPVDIMLNKQPLALATLASGWRAYRVVAPGARIGAGRNELSFRYAKTGRPSDFDTASTDVRNLSVRFDQIQIQPITMRAEFSFGSKNALAQAALGEGWARDPNDRGTGTWTIGQRALFAFQLARAETTAPVHDLTLTARTPRGVAERSVQLLLNGASLGSLTFSEKKTSAAIEVPNERLKSDNELVLEFAKLEPPSVADPGSKDTRLLGLRVFELNVAPKALASK